MLPNLEARQSDSRRVLVLPKLSPPSTKLWSPGPKFTVKIPDQFLHTDSAFNLLCILSCRTLLDRCVTLQIVSSGLNSPKVTPVKTHLLNIREHSKLSKYLRPAEYFSIFLSILWFVSAFFIWFAASRRMREGKLKNFSLGSNAEGSEYFLK